MFVLECSAFFASASISVAMMHCVFICLLTSSGRSSSAIDLLRQMRKVDPRLPETMATKTNRGSAYLLPGLGEDFLGFLERLRKVL